MYAKLDKSSPCPFPLKPTETYLGESIDGYYTVEMVPIEGLGSFFGDVANMFKRMVKFTPKSFTPANLYKGLINTTLTTASFGAYQLLPKNIKKTVYDIGTVAVPVVAGAALAAASPAIMSSLMPKLQSAASILGKNVSTIGKTLFGAMSKLPASEQSNIAQQVTAQDIAAMEKNGVIPPHIQAMINQADYATNQLAVENLRLRQENEAILAEQMKQARQAMQQSFMPVMGPTAPVEPDSDIAPSTIGILLAGGVGLVAVLLGRK